MDKYLVIFPMNIYENNTSLAVVPNLQHTAPVSAHTLCFLIARVTRHTDTVISNPPTSHLHLQHKHRVTASSTSFSGFTGMLTDSFPSLVWSLDF